MFKKDTYVSNIYKYYFFFRATKICQNKCFADKENAGGYCTANRVNKFALNHESKCFIRLCVM